MGCHSYKGMNHIYMVYYYFIFATVQLIKAVNTEVSLALSGFIHLKV